MSYTYNTTAWETEAKGSQVQGLLGLQSEFKYNSIYIVKLCLKGKKSIESAPLLKLKGEPCSLLYHCSVYSFKALSTLFAVCIFPFPHTLCLGFSTLKISEQSLLEGIQSSCLHLLSCSPTETLPMCLFCVLGLCSSTLNQALCPCVV